MVRLVMSSLSGWLSNVRPPLCGVRPGMRRVLPWVLPRAVMIGSLSVLVMASPPAAACSFPPPSVERTVPLDGAMAVPTNARVRVTYATGSQGQMQCGARPAAPLLRVAVVDDAGQPIADASFTPDAGTSPAGSWVQATDDNPRNSTIWEFRPQTTLAQNTTYELLDAYPTSCPCPVVGGCAVGPIAVFARFTTGARPDTTMPTFSGISSELCVRETCGGTDPSCCGPYNHLTFRIVPSDDANDDNLVGIHYYARKDPAAYDFTHPVSPATISDPLDSITTPRWDIPLSPGSWHIIARAFDIAGNEDSNMVEAQITLPLLSSPICARANADGGLPMPDFMFPGLPDGYTYYGADMSIVDTGNSCSCALARPKNRGAGPLAAMCSALGVVALLLRRRRR